ncbi:MAG: tRNA pseudouridine(38-40) synthase TruA [Methanomicrobiales archaeon]|nr:tRNA pseudouridine(38-40) synthase TruA [Methanomicrobiales archaeon]
MRLALLVAYIGDGFWGSQLQPGLRTVEGEFIRACERLSLFSDWREAGFAFSGRTDRGVHAYSQVCALATEHPERAIGALNQQLPRDCWCRGWAEVADGFHPRYAAISRTYRYFFMDPELDPALMGDAASLFIGSHDFSAFARTEGKNPIRTILNAGVRREGEFTVFEVKGESFLWHMVRGMASALASVGRGEMTESELERLLREGGNRTYPAAPAAGLVLWDVDCGIEFAPLGMERRQIIHLKDLFGQYAIRAKILSMLHPMG